MIFITLFLEKKNSIQFLLFLSRRLWWNNVLKRNFAINIRVIILLRYVYVYYIGSIDVCLIENISNRLIIEHYIRVSSKDHKRKLSIENIFRKSKTQFYAVENFIWVMVFWEDFFIVCFTVFRFFFSEIYCLLIR